MLQLIFGIPPLVTLLLIEWAHITAILLFYKDGIIQLIFIHLLWGLFLWSFIQIMRTNAGKVEREPAITYTISYRNGQQRFCHSCQTITPDRAHHCDICNTCVLRQDHHCPWLYNCVGLYTHKLFILFNFYGSLYCLLCCLTMTSYYPLFKLSNLELQFELNVFMVMVASGLFSIALFIFFCLHFYYCLQNMTSMDAIGYPNTRFASRYKLNIFKLDTCRNLKSVFGESILLWLVPIKPDLLCNGYEYEINAQATELLEAFVDVE